MSLEHLLISCGNVNISRFSDESFVEKLQQKISILKDMEVMCTWNRSIKAAFWKSFGGFKFIFDDIENCFTLVKRFAEEYVLWQPSKKKTKAQQAALVGLKNHSKVVPVSERISESACIFTVKYLNKCLRVLSCMLFDSEQIKERLHIFKALRLDNHLHAHFVYML